MSPKHQRIGALLRDFASERIRQTETAAHKSQASQFRSKSFIQARQFPAAAEPGGLIFLGGATCLRFSPVS
jgi:hypothetical protein